VIGIPVVIIAAVIAVANREAVWFSLDPFDRQNPAVSVYMPLFLLLFIVFAVGLLFGWAAAVWTRRRPKEPGRSVLPWRGQKPKPPQQ
jgi:hypothetical protein